MQTPEEKGFLMILPFQDGVSLPIECVIILGLEANF